MKKIPYIIYIFIYTFLTAISFLVLFNEIKLSQNFMAVMIILLSTELGLGLIEEIEKITEDETLKIK